MLTLDPAVGAIWASAIAAVAGIIAAVVASRAKHTNSAEHGQVIDRLDKLNDKFDRHIEWHLSAASEWQEADD